MLNIFNAFLGYFLKKVPTCLKLIETCKLKHFCDQNDQIKTKTGGSEIKGPYLTKKSK